MSSHREAPAISRDPVADNTDTYAFVSPDDPSTVTIIANYLPLEAPFGGPNFFEFGPDVRYRINIDNDGDGDADIIYEFAFQTQVANPNSFLYNTGPIDSISSANWNRKQFYSVTRITRDRRQVLATNLACPPCNVGVLSTPNYDALAAQAVHGIGGGRTVFAGQRLEGFYVDLGSIFDLGNLRPFQNLHVLGGSLQAMSGVNGTNDFSVHSIALKVPKQDLTRHGVNPSDPNSSASVVGVWASASRQSAVVHDGYWGNEHQAGAWLQVSRLGNPLFNEVLVGMGFKDLWNATAAVGRQAVRRRRPAPGAGHSAAGAVPGCVPQPGQVHRAAGRSRGDPAHRHPVRNHSRLPELHREDAGGHAQAEPGHPAGEQPERARDPRRRPGRVPERTARVRRRGQRGATGDRRR